jgi:hypothetical protein
MGVISTVMKKNTTVFAQRLTTVISSNKFFACILVLMAVEALWIAFSGRYPMAFDEDFHLGLIHLYSHHISPFWEAQPSGADSFGAVVRDPSYLYQYLMSFPYRAVSVVTNSQTAQVISLRVLNVALFTGGLVLWSKLLLKTGASKTIVHCSILAFVLIPVVPLLAAQINYDNLFIPVVAGVFLVAANFGEELAMYKRVNTKLLIQLLILCLFASLIKYAFLPILVAVIVYVLIRLIQAPASWRKLLLSLAFGWTLMERSTRWLLLIVLVVFSALFAERYLINLIRYHQPVPDCAKVLSIEQCSAYGPWIRNYNITNNRDPNANSSPLVYSVDWFYGMWLRSFFAVAGPGVRFETRGPLLLPGIGVIVLASIASIALAVKARTIWRKYDTSALTLLLVVIAGYLSLLWLDGYQSFVRLGETVAINGRYLLAVALPLILLGALGITETLRHRQDLKLLFVAVAIFILAWGGGTLTFILRSRDAWYWPNSTVQRVNFDIRQTLGPITPGYRHPIEFMSRN